MDQSHISLGILIKCKLKVSSLPPFAWQPCLWGPKEKPLEKTLGTSWSFCCCDQCHSALSFILGLKALTKIIRSSPSENLLLSYVMNASVNSLEDFFLLSFEIWGDAIPSSLTASHRAEWVHVLHVKLSPLSSMACRTLATNPQDPIPKLEYWQALYVQSLLPASPIS